MWMENKNNKYMFRESYIDPLTEKKKIVSVTMKSKSRASQKQAKPLKNVFKNGYRNINS